MEDRTTEVQSSSASSFPLSALAVGESAIVKELQTIGSMRRRFLDIGLTEGTVVECVGQSPFGDPCAYLIRSAVIAIRASDGQTVQMCARRQKEQAIRPKQPKQSEGRQTG